MRRTISWPAVWLALLASGPAMTATPATVRFATACADCHEGECSGRLSFAQRPAATFTHIRNYAGPVDDTLAGQLYSALERMKSQCRYAMPPPVDLLGGDLDASRLASLRDAWSAAYFIPLTNLAEGSYRLSGEMPAGGRVRIELVDAEFEPWLDRCEDARDGRFAIGFDLPDTVGGFLRLRPAAGQSIVGLSLITGD